MPKWQNGDTVGFMNFRDSNFTSVKYYYYIVKRFSGVACKWCVKQRYITGYWLGMDIIPEEQIHKSNIKVQTVFRITCLLHAKKTLTFGIVNGANIHNII